MADGFGEGPVPIQPSAQDESLTPDRTVLRICSGPAVGREYSLHGMSLVVGRNNPPQVTVDIDLSDCESGPTPMLSRRHAEFQWVNGTLNVRDLGSKNGTRLRGSRLPINGKEPVTSDAKQHSDLVPLGLGDRLLLAALEVEISEIVR